MSRKVQLPDGRTIEIPDDATPEQLAALKEKLRAKYAAQTPGQPADDVPPNPPAAPPKKRNLLEDLLASAANSNFGRGVQRIAAGDVSPEEAAGAMGKSVEAMVRGVPGSDYVAAGGAQIANVLTGQGINPNEVDEQRARRKDLRQELPMQNLAGELMGAGVAADKIAKAPGLAVKAAQPVLNTLRLGGQGAVVSGGVSLAQEGDAGRAAKDAVVGAVINPAMAGVLRVAGQGAKAAKEFFRPSLSGFTALAKRVKEKGESLAQAEARLKRDFDEMKALRGGQAPSIAELVEESGRRRLAAVSETHTAAGETFERAAVAADEARPALAEQVIAGTGARRTADEIAARETAAGNVAVENARTTARERLAQSRQRTTAQVEEQRAAAEAARTAIRSEIQAATALDDRIVSAERATALRDRWATETMRALEQNPIVFSQAAVREYMQTPAVGDVLVRMQRAARASEQGQYERIIDAIAEGRAVPIPTRIVDTLRRELRAVASRGEGGSFNLNNIAQDIENTARGASRGYDEFLSEYETISDEIEGIARGARVLTESPTVMQAAVQDRGAVFARGAERGARVAVGEAAARSPEKLARAISSDPTRVSPLGRSAEAVVDAARRGVGRLDEATAAAQRVVDEGREAVAAIRREGSEALREAAGTARKRVSDARRAETVMRDDVSEFEQYIRGVAPDMRDDVAAIARDKVAGQAGRSDKAARETLERVQERGVQSNLGAALGPEEAARIARAGRLETRAAENLDTVRPPKPKPINAGDAFRDVVDTGIAATGRVSGGFVSNFGRRIINKAVSFGMPPGAASKLAEYATDPAMAEQLLARMRKAGLSEEKANELRALISTAATAAATGE